MFDIYLTAFWPLFGRQGEQRPSAGECVALIEALADRPPPPAPTPTACCALQ